MALRSGAHCKPGGKDLAEIEVWRMRTERGGGQCGLRVLGRLCKVKHNGRLDQALEWRDLSQLSNLTYERGLQDLT